jgi:hypothetical protein
LLIDASAAAARRDRPALNAHGRAQRGHVRSRADGASHHDWSLGMLLLPLKFSDVEKKEVKLLTYFVSFFSSSTSKLDALLSAPKKKQEEKKNAPLKLLAMASVSDLSYRDLQSELKDLGESARG